MEKEMASHSMQESDKANPEIRIIREGFEREKMISGLEKIIEGLMDTGMLTEADIERALEKAREREGMGRQRSVRKDEN